MPLAVRMIRPLFAAMVTLLTAGLAGAFVSGFGGPVPPWTVVTAIGAGTMAMASLFACLILGRLREG